MAANSKSWQMNFPTAAAVWAAVVLYVAYLGERNGFGGWRFFVALGVAAALFAFEFFLAAPRVQDRFVKSLGNRGGMLAPLVPLFAVLVYCFGVTGNWTMLLAGAAYAVIPALLLASSRGKPPGTWEDYAAAVALWLPAWLQPPYRLLYHIFPYPPPLTHTFTILMALSTGVAAFVLLRRLPGVGYAVEWRRGFAWNFAFNFVVYAATAIPIGLKIGFLTWHPELPHLRSVPLSGVGSFLLSAVGILLFTAWPEEFLFRGLLQNLLSKTLRSEWAGLIVASVIFGFAHIFHAPVPNWKYVFLATIAGIFYGHAWMKTGSLVPGVLIHALVDTLWHVLFH
ncbi:MAG: type II CAAX endopeptidase family protein [Candidatus Acidiferrales bacterium]|jgi:membrane protease YdiL (CAAX protease family)